MLKSHSTAPPCQSQSSVDKGLIANELWVARLKNRLPPTPYNSLQS
jgi:hypothetical protein